MFLFDKTDKLNIKSNKATIFNGISVWLKLENDKKLDLSFKDTDGKTACFESEFGKASIQIVENDNILALSASGELFLNREKGVFLDNADFNLNSNCAIGIDIAELTGLTEYSANYAVSAFWTENSFGSDVSQLKPKTQALLYKTESNDFTYALTLCDDDYKSLLAGNQNGGVTLSLFCLKRGHIRFNSKALVVAFGNDPYTLPEIATEFGLKFLKKIGGSRKKRNYPELFEYLGWCSWDAFPLCVSHEGLLEKAKEFKALDIPVKWAIIDDMWATLKFPDTREIMHDNELSTVEADKERFPNGLEGAISDLKEKYNLAVGIWHPVTGYWHGFDKDGDLAKKYGHLLTETEDGRLAVDPSLDKTFLYHNMYYNYLKQCGADFVKVDNQSCIEWFYRKLGTVGSIAKNMHMAIEAAVGANFGGVMMNCMGCASENLWNRPNSALSRCSNDFLPEDRLWFIKHILQCSFNCYNHGGFIYCDWDMFWTDDGQATKNSLIRAISGGPIYISDKVGRSKKEVILPTVLSDGRILRCENPAVPIRDCLLSDPETNKKAFKLWNKTENGSVIAAFNLDKDEKPVDGLLSPADIEGNSSETYLAFDFFNQSANIVGLNETVAVTLNNYDEFTFLGFIPVVDGFAPIGLTDKYITTATFNKFGSGKYTVKDGGTFAFYSKTKPKQILCDGKAVTVTSANGFDTVTVGEKGQSHILEFSF